MKTFFKIFGISFICFTLLIGAAVIAFLKFYEPSPVNNNHEGDVVVIPSPPSGNEENEQKSELEQLVKESKRINVVLLGMEGPRTDTIIFASFDPKSKNLDLVSIPRDTLYHIKGYDEPDQKKINAVYGRSGVKGTMQAISHVLGGVPVHEYVKITYEGVENIVDSLGGVRVNIPFDMNYDDPYATPKLHIHLEKGVRELNGKEAVQFLRFRKNNDGTGYPDGDIGRIKAQQRFLMSAVDKALSFRLPVVAHTVFKFVKTSMKLEDVIYYAKNAIGISKDNIRTYKLPGRSTINGLSYFIHDEGATEEMMIEIYKRGLSQ